MRLSIYLFNDGVKSYKDVIRTKCLQGDNAYIEIKPKNKLPYNCKAYIQTNKGKAPKWCDFIEGFFDVRSLELENQSSSFILLIKVSERMFAATFGHGHSAIDRTKLEPNFGLKVTLNSINPNQIDTMDTRNIDLVTKQRRTHVNVGSSVSQFEVNEMMDWVRFVSGKPSEQSFARKMAGADSLSITRDEKIERLGTLCEELLKSFGASEYKKQFGFIDYLRMLSKSDSLVLGLEDNLKKLIKNRETEQITVAHPDIPDNSVVEYIISSGTKRVETDEITLDSVYELLDQLPAEVDPVNKVIIYGVDDLGTMKTARYSLKDFLVCEIIKSGNTYIHSLGQWFNIDAGYVDEVRQRVRAIPDLTGELCFPSIKHGENEGCYNTRIAKDKGWLLLDKAMFTFGKANDKIEAADILSPDREFICVKKMASSATLSHLFAQGSVSAKLLRSVPEYEAELSKRYIDYWPQKRFDEAGIPTFVYTIPTEKKKPIAECMFFFSLINLIDHVRAIRNSGYKVALCKVEYDPSSKKQKNKTKRK